MQWSKKQQYCVTLLQHDRNTQVKYKYLHFALKHILKLLIINRLLSTCDNNCGTSINGTVCVYLTVNIYKCSDSSERSCFD